MIIPVKCFTCGKVLGDKYRFYVREISKRKIEKNLDVDKIEYLTKNTIDKTIEGEVLDKLDEKGKGLWHNIHMKRKRGERMRKKGW